MREEPGTGQLPQLLDENDTHRAGQGASVCRGPLPSFFRMFRILQGGYIYPEEEPRFGAIPRGMAEVDLNPGLPRPQALFQSNLAQHGWG